jgi:hypothetical protein
MRIKDNVVKMVKDHKLKSLISYPSSQQIRDIVLVSVGVLGGIFLVRIVEGYSEDDKEISPMS